MYKRIIINSILILSLVIIQLSLISGLPARLNNLNLILVILIFILGLAGLDLAVWWIIGTGVLLDIFFFMPFGVFLICLSLTIIVTNFFLTSFFTDRSIFSFLALVSLATFVYEILLTLISYVVYLLSPVEISLILNKTFWLAKLSQLGLNLIITIFIFYLVHFIKKELRPVFLVKNK